MTDSKPLSDILIQSLQWARTRDYTGWDYADGLSSPLASMLDRSTIATLCLQEGIKRSPINIRPLFGVPQRRSFKGAALFLLANIQTYEVTNESLYLDEAIALGDWLLANRQTDPFGWGHNHALQTLSGTVPRNTPSVVTTSFVTRALLALAEYHDIPLLDELPATIRTFLHKDLAYESVSDGATIQYRAGATDAYTVINANALGGRLLTDVATGCNDPSLLSLATPLFEYVAAQQTSEGGWVYADPQSASHLSMDPHHNGFILDSFQAYARATGSEEFVTTYETGLEFFMDSLFEPSGAPRWDETTAFPRDIHGAAQGIITCTRAEEYAFANQILHWTLRTLYHPEGRFGYRKGRFYTRNTTLMRWCQAWMCLALATMYRDGHVGH